MSDLTTGCCIVGGGPAGMMAGYLLARAGVPVTVLEKHADFLRDFRGDTLHPSTLQLMDELGLYERLLRLPHHKVYALRGRFGAMEAIFADFTHLPTRCEIHRADAAMGFPQFSRARSEDLSLLPVADGNRGN